MCLFNLYSLLFVLISLLILIYIILTIATKILEYFDYGQEKKNDLEFTKFFLNNLKLLRDFSEKDVEFFNKRFDFSRNLFYLEHEKSRWDTDSDLFIQTCLTAMNILSHLCNKESIYYRNKRISKILVFTDRIMCNKLKNNNSDFFNNEKIYHIYTAFANSMYVYRDYFKKIRPVSEYGDYIQYMDFYMERFKGEFEMKTESEIFEKYKIYFDACKMFNECILKYICI